jgi:hypothetical protein
MPALPDRAVPSPGETNSTEAVAAKLRALCSRFPPGLSTRVVEVLDTARDAIVKLSDLDLVRYEGDASGGGSLSLAVWEELAPLVAGTVESTNALIEIAGRFFPPRQAPTPDADDLDAAFGPAGIAHRGAQDPTSEEEEIASLLQAVTNGLRRDVARLGERLRNPSVMADPWNLVSDLLEFRGRLRTGIGELIYQVCLRVEETVERTEVIPGYVADLESALLVRAASSNLAFLFRGHARRIAASGDRRLKAALAEALKDVTAFSRTRALHGLRTADKRIFLETRERLLQLHRGQSLDGREVKGATENMARFLDSLSMISRRENLRLHDRARLAEVGRLLESAQELGPVRAPAESRARLLDAVHATWALYGRDAQIDTYLRGQRYFPVEWLSDGEIEAELSRINGLLAGVAQP